MKNVADLLGGGGAEEEAAGGAGGVGAEKDATCRRSGIYFRRPSDSPYARYGG